MSAENVVQYEAANSKKWEDQVSRLTPEEIRLLKDCGRESFLYRCLPLCCITMGSTYLGVKKGFLKGHPKYGALFKIMAAGGLSWLVGKMSYRKICEDKFVHLPNSTIGEIIRKKRGYVVSEFQKEKLSKPDSDDQSQNVTNFLPDQNYDPSFGALNLDVDKNVQLPGLDDRERPTTDSLNEFVFDDQPAKHNTSYADLRKQNRESYEQQYRKPPSPVSSFSTLPPRSYDNFPQRTYHDDGSREPKYPIASPSRKPYEN